MNTAHALLLTGGIESARARRSLRRPVADVKEKGTGSERRHADEDRISIPISIGRAVIVATDLPG